MGKLTATILSAYGCFCVQTLRLEKPAIPDDCQGGQEVWVADGHANGPLAAYPTSNGACFGLCSCYDVSAKMPKYVKYEMLKSAERPACDGRDAKRGMQCYDRSHLTFKVNPGLCEGCRRNGNVHSCRDCSNQASYAAEAFTGTLCPSCTASGGPFRCGETGDPSNPVGYYCAYYSAFEDRECPAWEKFTDFVDYDLGHLAASSDTYDLHQVRSVCKRRKSSKNGGEQVQEGDKSARFSEYASCKWHSSYMMTNIVPQASKFNRGCWRDIEKAVQKYSMEVEDLNVVAGNDMKHFVLREGVLPWRHHRLGANTAGVPLYMYKVACQKKTQPKCIGWYMANRNFHMVPGCRSPLTLDALAAKLELEQVPGFYETRSSSLLTELLQYMQCAESHFGEPCGGKTGLYHNADESEINPDEGTCHNGTGCEDECRCCNVAPAA